MVVACVCGGACALLERLTLPKVVCGAAVARSSWTKAQRNSFSCRVAAWMRRICGAEWISSMAPLTCSALTRPVTRSLADHQPSGLTLR